jgi:hypothetical protein
VSFPAGNARPLLKKQLFQTQIQHADKKSKPRKHALTAYHKIKTEINHYKQTAGFSRYILTKMTTAEKTERGRGGFRRLIIH